MHNITCTVYKCICTKHGQKNIAFWFISIDKKKLIVISIEQTSRPHSKELALQKGNNYNIAGLLLRNGYVGLLPILNDEDTHSFLSSCKTMSCIWYYMYGFRQFITRLQNQGRHPFLVYFIRGYSGNRCMDSSNQCVAGTNPVMSSANSGSRKQNTWLSITYYRDKYMTIQSVKY